MEGDQLTIAELVRNGTMSADMAGLLWAAVDEAVSFMTVAVPQNAGKSTLANAVLALRAPDVPLHPVGNEPELLERLKRERLGGYLVVGEFNPRMVRNYIWGEPVRRVFDALTAGYSLQTSLHAPGAVEGMREITRGSEVSDERAAAMKLVLYIEMFGESWAPDVKRRLLDVYEVRGVEGGEPIGQSLFRWHKQEDRFEKVAEPQQFGRDRADVARRSVIIGELAASGRTSATDVAQAVASFGSAAGSQG